MKLDLLKFIWERAGHRCEYCLFPASCAWLPFQLDHIIAEKHGGLSDSSNLALSCYYCNSFKGPYISGIDPEGHPDVAVQLFHPRKDVWSVHFEWHGPLLRGKSSKGRATIEVLRINATESVEVRRLLAKATQPD